MTHAATQHVNVPRLARAEAVETGASAFYLFLRTFGVRFDLRRKVEEATEYTLREGGSTFAVPTKLQGTSKFQPTLAALGAIPHKYRKLAARVVPDTRAGKEAQCQVALHFGGDRLGFVQDKHTPWMLAMLQTTATGQIAPGVGVNFYALQVTGGEPGRPTRGLNVVITGAGERAALLLERRDLYRAEAEAELEREAEEAAMMEAAERGLETF
jgi:hypothetical protein